MKCLIICNGSIIDDRLTAVLIREHDFIICADGGVRHLLKINQLPDLIVGDLDSMDKQTIGYLKGKGVPIYPFPSKKDYTDTELSIQYALEKGASEITLLGAIGSRMDHTLANIMLLLPLIDQGIQAKIINEHNEIIVVNKKITIRGNIGDFISIIPLNEKVEGITLEGFMYPLDHATLIMGSSRGISNQLKDTTATISIQKGNILLIKAKD